LTSDAIDAKLQILRREVSFMGKFPKPGADDPNKSKMVGNMTMDDILVKGF
jgi:hypothetical protein